jgi:alanyl-tRNA synthetase
VLRTGDIGLFKITEETGVAQGVRRLEAVTGEGAVAHVRRLEQELVQAAERLRSSPLEVASRIEKQQLELREREREIARLKAQIASGGGAGAGSGQGGAGGGAEQVGKYWVLVRDVGVADPKVLRDAADKLRVKLDPGVLVLAGAEGGKVALVCAVTAGAQDRFDAGQITRTLGQELGWKGGGRKDLAQGGGALPEGAGLGPILEGWRKKVEELVGAAR